MSVPIELLDKYLATFLDFWRLRPRRFFTQISDEPQRYLSPAQFIGMSSILLLALLGVAFALGQADLEKLAGEKMPSPEASAGRLLVFFIFILVVNTLFYRIVSPL